MSQPLKDPMVWHVCARSDLDMPLKIGLYWFSRSLSWWVTSTPHLSLHACLWAVAFSQASFRSSHTSPGRCRPIGSNVSTGSFPMSQYTLTPPPSPIGSRLSQRPTLGLRYLWP